jgi:RNA polymerase sigma-70 factor (TIGR02943 family)
MTRGEEEISGRGSGDDIASLPSAVGDPKNKKTDAGAVMAAAQWVEEHGDYLYRYALMRVRVSQVAEDLVQDTFFAAIGSYERFSNRSSERTWLCAILKNKITEYFRKLGRETSFTDMEFLSAEFGEKFVAEGWWVHAQAPTVWRPESDIVAHRVEFRAILHKCLGKLPDRIANVFTMREMEDVSTADICRTLSISENNLWVMLHRARMALQECLSQNWFNKGDR